MRKECIYTKMTLFLGLFFGVVVLLLIYIGFKKEYDVKYGQKQRRIAKNTTRYDEIEERVESLEDKNIDTYTVVDLDTIKRLMEETRQYQYDDLYRRLQVLYNHIVEHKKENWKREDETKN
jgi:hypothetical protein